MKKTLVATIIGLGVVASTFAQGRIVLDTYSTSPYPQITYGAGSGGPLNTPVNTAWTVGLYYAVGNIVGSIAPDPSGVALPSDLGALTLATGVGSTAPIVATGWFTTTSPFSVPGTSADVSQAVTVMVVAYNGASYASSLVRGHSQAFSITTDVLGSGTSVGSLMNSFQVLPVPEPSTFALAGLGLASLLIFRRRK